MPELPLQADILVVGGGPCGLVAALSLQKHGCSDIVVVDSAPAGLHTTRAIALFPATLEACCFALDEIGCADAIVAEGIKTSGGKLWDGHRLHRAAYFDVLAPYTRFAFTLLVPQQVTERVLRKYAEDRQILVHRPCRVINMQVNQDNPEVTNVIFEDGHVLQAKYVVGADGTRSTIRQIVGIPFRDPTTSKCDVVRQAVQADVILEAGSSPPFRLNDLLQIHTDDNFFTFFPLRSDVYDAQNLWRIVCGVRTGEAPRAPNAEYLQSLLDTIGLCEIPSVASTTGQPVKIKKVLWSTRFRMDSAVVDKYYTRLSRSSEGDGAQVVGGVVTLIGDAAHKQPPVGGQGLNLGLRDAVFLGPALAEHLRKSAGTPFWTDRAHVDQRLVDWSDERRQRALAGIKLSTDMLYMQSWRTGWTSLYGIIPINWTLMRCWVLWFLDTIGVQPLTWQLSGLVNR
ncbi:FAD/NAD(P)-binding domain-containing protein [Trametopsis cervina]|nr:FAD/NAD(P)-binding domain-containing protein [Trametopsis cervina]